MKSLLRICGILLVASCQLKTNLPSVSALQVADSVSLPNDSLAFYFPKNSFDDKASIDSFVQNWYSSTLYNMKEPILYKSYIGHDIYRFLWLRSFHRPVVFTLHQNGGQIWLNTKMLDRQPLFYDEKIRGIPKNLQEEYVKNGYLVDKLQPDLMVKIADRKANIVYNKNIFLSARQWNEFGRLLEKADFWALPRKIDDGSKDGAEWIIEARLKNKYHLVDYHCPYRTDYEKAGVFLIKLSGLEEKVY